MCSRRNFVAARVLIWAVFISFSISMRSIIRSVLSISLLSFFVAQTATAQIAKDTTRWNDEELYEEDAPTAPAYFGVAGGIVGGLLMPNLDAFNKNIAQRFVGKDLSNQVFMLGGQGFIAIPWIKNLRLGGTGMGGRTEECCVDTLIDGQNYSRMLEYHVGYGALTVDYVLPLNIRKFWIVPGVELGFGAVDIFAQQAFQRSSFQIASEFDQPSRNLTHTYHASFFLYKPQVQFEYALAGFSMVRAYVGYQGTAMNDWTVDRGVSLGNTDELKDVNGSGLTFGLGIFFGLFQ
jgi:hypothetical protein